MRKKLTEILQKALGPDVPAELSVPEESVFGHYSTNVAMRLAKARGKAPLALAEELAAEISASAPAGFFEKVEAVKPGFINFWLSKRTIQDALGDLAAGKHLSGAGGTGRGETAGGGSEAGGTAEEKGTVIVEYSDVNIAKVMNLGHFRTTVIGAALANLLEFAGYRVIRWNYLGDWGTQFGKLIAAYKLWGSEERVKESPVEELQGLYVRFHNEAKTDRSIEVRGRDEFRKLEDGDPENRRLWEWFKKESLEEFERTYRILGVSFDVWIGEAFFEPMLKGVVEELMEEGIAERSEGAIVVKLDHEQLPPALIQKSDGASLYLTRDIANLRYRMEQYHPEKIFYVVGGEQSLHFEQLFAIAPRLKIEAAKLVHVKHGLVLGEGGKKFSTREGRNVSLASAIEKAEDLTRRVVEAKNPDLSGSEKEIVIRAVAVGALKYNDLKENRMTDIVFDWEEMLDFTGDSGPYLQYAYARLASILRKANEGGAPAARADVTLLETEHELGLVRKIAEFPDVARRAAGLYATSILAAYLYGLAVAANKFYETTPVLKDENAPRRAARLALARTAAETLRAGLGLLGIETPEKI